MEISGQSIGASALVLPMNIQGWLFFGHLMWRVVSLEKALMLGKTEGKRRRGQQRMRWLDSITNKMDMNLSKLQEVLENRGARCAAVHGVTKSQTWLSTWTTTTNIYLYFRNENVNSDLVSGRGHTLERWTKLGCLLFLRAVDRLQGMHKHPNIAWLMLVFLGERP